MCLVAYVCVHVCVHACMRSCMDADVCVTLCMVCGACMFTLMAGCSMLEWMSAPAYELLRSNCVITVPYFE